MAAEPAFPFQKPLGARPITDELTEFRVWAPRARKGVQLVLGSSRPAIMEMDDVGYGVFELLTPAGHGTDYRFKIGSKRLPDPASRSQPTGLRGPSRVVGTAGFGLSSPPAGFRATPLNRAVIYELHIGTFSPEGTFEGAIPHLADLASLGITALNVMPIGEFPGARGWGYDGVYISSSQSSYGGPEGFAAFVDAAHDAGLAVYLDVVYNHLGPASDAVEAFGPYFTQKYSTPWGSALNYDDALCDPVREWVCQSAEGWFADFGIDGLRLDAVHAIYDSSPEFLVAEISRRVKAINPRAVIIAESALNDPKVTSRSSRGGWGADAAWADDFHHSVRTLITGEHEGYYADFGTVAGLAKALGRPFVYDGVYSQVRQKIVGAPVDDMAPSAFVVCSQNHDQVGNRAFGDRLGADVQPIAAFLTLLSGFTPMLFMGEEYGERAPFQFFCDHIDPLIADATREGRRAEFAAFASFGHEVPDPMAESTFRDSKLTRVADPAVAELYRSLIAMRTALPRGNADEIEFDEAARWVRVTRGEYEIVAHVGPGSASVGARGLTVKMATSADVKLARGKLTLPAFSGAVLKRKEIDGD